LSQQNYTIFLSSHLLNEVELMCTDVVIIQKGEKRLQGKMKELLAQGKEFAIEATPANLATAVLQNYCQTSITIDTDGWIVFKAERFEVPTILSLLIEKGVQIYQVQERRNSLEKLFLELTGQPSESFATAKMEVSLS
jgi:ABC-2 type transport system ATP-binding protein